MLTDSLDRGFPLTNVFEVVVILTGDVMQGIIVNIIEQRKTLKTLK